MPTMTNNVWSSPIVITGIGMLTSVGHNAYQTCASVRADIVRMTDIDYFTIENEQYEDVPVSGCPIVNVTDGYLGLGRWTRMVTWAITDLISNSGTGIPDWENTGFFISLPPISREGVDPKIFKMLGLRIGQWNNVKGIENQTRVYPHGYASPAKGFCMAAEKLHQKKICYAVVGGVDSLVEPETLNYFHEAKRLKTEDNSDGFIPGEGAAFLLLESLEQAQERKANIMAVIENASMGDDLGNAILGALNGHTDDEFSEHVKQTKLMICDLNGESDRAMTFGKAMLKAGQNIRSKTQGQNQNNQGQKHDSEDLALGSQIWHPADCIGDTGAASFAISACLGARALQRKYAESEKIMICGSSERGMGGAILLKGYQGGR
ncbi:MAG: hypothetical protein HQK65_00325 [Desulfamplus sp.]|nr:hypothetical protein [Desulfamplus sp.]